MEKNNYLRILHGLSELSGQNYYSTKGLKELGLKADTVVFYPHPFGYKYDISLNIYKNKIYLLPKYVVKLACFLIYSLFNYDVFHFHYGRSICNNFDLWVYDLLKKDYYFEFHGSELRDMEKFCEHSKQPYTPDLALPKRLKKRNAYISKKAKAIILHDDELIEYLPDGHAPVQVVPLRMDVDSFVPVFPDINSEIVKIVHAPSQRIGKGTDYILKTIDELKHKYKNVELILVEGKTHDEALKIYETADIIVDQIFTGTYGVFAIESMALGKPVISYISEDMLLSLPEELPIVSADVDSLYEKLESLIVDSKKRNDIGKKSREYVETYHDYRMVANVLQRIYSDELLPANGRDAFERVRRYKESI